MATEETERVEGDAEMQPPQRRGECWTVPCAKILVEGQTRNLCNRDVSPHLLIEPQGLQASLAHSANCNSLVCAVN